MSCAPPKSFKKSAGQTKRNDTIMTGVTPVQGMMIIIMHDDHHDDDQIDLIIGNL